MSPLISSSKQICPKPRPPPKHLRLTSQTQDVDNNKGGPNLDSDAEEEDKVQDALAGLIDTDMDDGDDDDNEMLSPHTVIPKGKWKTQTWNRELVSAKFASLACQ
ncbi:hypothetical protein VKT23_019555 [Stygiomarasmius scandens]|uniref:Uncharacterized protein n=1 Tax=Marasmiellus scandens TaxID=2682957 RepID=A0ABR1IL09_9AGAR